MSSTRARRGYAGRRDCHVEEAVGTGRAAARSTRSVPTGRGACSAGDPGISMRAARSRHGADGYFAVGIANSAPLGVLSGQRCMIDFWRV